MRYRDLFHVQEQCEIFLHSLFFIGLLKDSNKNTWIGLSGEEGAWKWVDETPYDYTNWSSGYPNQGTQACVKVKLK